MAYVELLDLKTYLGVTEDDDDALLVSLIDRAQAIFDGQTNRTFEATADTTRRFDATADVDGATLLLDRDLCSITTITNGDSTTIASTKYVTEPRNGTPYYAIRLLGSSGLSWSAASNGDHENAISILGKWAYSTTAPADVVEAIVNIATLLYRFKDNANDYSRTVVTATSTILPGGLSPTTLATIRRYKRLL